MSAHLDRFVIDRLPPAALQPEFRFDLPELRYPGILNAGAALIDEAIARGWGPRIAIRVPDATWTYADLAAAVNRAAHVLTADLGIVAGNRVLLRGVNSAELSAIWLGALKAGAVVVTTMPMLRGGEIAVMLDKAQIALALCQDTLLDDMQTAVGLAKTPCRVVSFGAGPAKGELDGLAAGKPDRFDAVATASDDPALIAFTSGSTGDPKATIHFHRDILAIADLFPRHILETRPDDIFLCSAPMAFTFGLGGHLVFPLRYGASSILLPNNAPPLFLAAIQSMKPTVVMTAPTAYHAMSAGAAAGLPHVRICVSAGEHLPRSIFERWEAATGHRIIDGIGATEMLHIFVANRPGDIRPGSTGRAVPGYSATILDAEGNPAKAGEIGRLAIKGPTGCRYLDDPRQAKYVVNGWNLTGDAYVQDDEGWFWFQSRTDDMIVSAGYNISGPEVEGAVLQHRAVAECAVIASPSAERGHVVKAFICLHAGFDASTELAKEIQDFVKATIAPFKYPRLIEFVDQLPRNQSGKLQRFVLRQREVGAANP